MEARDPGEFPPSDGSALEHQSAAGVGARGSLLIFKCTRAFQVREAGCGALVVALDVLGAVLASLLRFLALLLDQRVREQFRICTAPEPGGCCRAVPHACVVEH